MAENPVSDAVGSIFSGALTKGIYVILGLIVGGLILWIIYYFGYYKRQFNIVVRIRSDRANDPRFFFDYAAILTDRKTKRKYFKLLKTKVELPCPPFIVLESTNWGDFLDLWRKSEEDFVFLTKPAIDKEKMVGIDGKVYPIAQDKQRSVEADYYWIQKRKEENKKLLDTDSLLSKLLLYAPQLISGFFMLIILWIFMDKLPALVNNLNELVQGMKGLTSAQVVTNG